MTDDTVRKLEEAFKLDVTVEEACLCAGISKDTYYRKIKEDEGFSDEMERARMFATLRARQTVVREIGEDGDLALKFLERRCKAQYSPRSEISVNEDAITKLIQQADVNARPVQWEDIDPISPNQWVKSLGEGDAMKNESF